MKIGVWAAFVAALFATDARARGACQEREEIIKKLESKYHEQRVAIGVTRLGSLLEIFVGPSGDWTIIITRGGHLTCVADTGHGFRMIKPAAGGEKS